MPVLRIFGKKLLQRAHAQDLEQMQETEKVRVSGNGNGWEGQSMIQTPQTTRHTRPLDATSEWIGTRRYLANLPYALPKDAPEADRLNFQHYYLRRVFRDLYLAPLEKARVRSVLDVGCGTGRWACEMAQDFPHAQILGLDIELPSSGTFLMPPNLTFTPGNVLERMPFADHSFDYVHQRLLVVAIPTTQWPTVVAELVRVTKPGGWIELVEASDAYRNPGPALSQFLHWSQALSNERGIDLRQMAYIDELLMRAGLWRVEKRIIRVPIGSWGGRLGQSLAQNTLAAIEGMRGLYCQPGKLSQEQFDSTLASLPDEWNTYRTEFTIFAAYGQVRKEV